MTRLRGALCFCLTLLACNRETGTPAAAPQAPVGWFQERAAAAGLNFVHQSGHRARFLMPENVCGGVALFDMDGDGDLDAYFVQSGSADGPAEERPPNQLFRNNGDGTFTDVTAGSGSADRGYGMGVATGDYDGDGDLDLYVTNLGPNVLLRNDGDGHFTDVTDRASVGESRWSASAAFLDYDADGDLDLFVTNYINWSVVTELECYNLSIAQLDYSPPEAYNAPTADTLYMNNGDGTFTDVSEVTGIADGMGTGLGVIAGDFTNDGFIDVFVANDGMMDRLWVNDGAGRFTDQGVLLGCAVDENGVPKAGMGVVAADYDSDGDLDLLVCNRRTESDSLFRNTDGAFVDATAGAGLAVTSRVFTRFGLGWIDCDNDGWPDLYEAN
ncbi:MAG: VCBS repeat-containing protein, partial [Planctomycetes bacterium]|nr:VCBS repeat-containing protein [Planctomycetota bacterium]